MKYEFFGGTKVGKKHSENEDQIVLRRIENFNDSESVIIGVIDGASGAAFGGSLAGWVADQLLRDEISATNENPNEFFASYLTELNTSFRRDFEDIEEMLESYASLCLAFICNDNLTVFWAGDTLAYLTECETKTTRRLVKPHGKGNVISRYFSGVKEFDFDQVSLRFDSGDILTIVSDGAIQNEIAFSDLYADHGFDESIVEQVLSEGTSSPYSDDVSIVACRRIA